MVAEKLCLFLAIGVFLCLTQVESYRVDITYLKSAVAKGAVCMDGSPPAYHFSPGFGKGSSNWLLLFEGGGWCNNATTCLAKRDGRLGSSKAMVKYKSFSGILSNKASKNPDFYDWNKARVRYCDGSSYTGDVEAVDPATKLHFRGNRIFHAMIHHFKTMGLSNAKNVLLAGCSAGGLGVILQCDHFRNLMPPTTNVKCLADAGYFINAKTVAGTSQIEEIYADVVRTHNSAKVLPKYCTSKMSPGLCFFPENVVAGIKTPLFILNAAYDSWQIKNILAPGVADPHGKWRNCKKNIKNCSSAQIGVMQSYRQNFLHALSKAGRPTSRGMFINSCYAHCQAGVQSTWMDVGSPVLSGKTTIGKAVGDWYFDRDHFKAIDCPYPCDKSCHNREFD
ncbi:pectin acetylesterase, family CE13 [Zostera marina]|uniref:Pectin acetylesterase n=1 Tax=Zostera marina TaxID=29655 RepID=A0A0K9PST2_ZOSMR|nr:pectin acetylesterase, family CE13 [Zostera marina]